MVPGFFLFLFSFGLVVCGTTKDPPKLIQDCFFLQTKGQQFLGDDMLLCIRQYLSWLQTTRSEYDQNRIKRNVKRRYNRFKELPLAEQRRILGMIANAKPPTIRLRYGDAIVDDRTRFPNNDRSYRNTASGYFDRSKLGFKRQNNQKHLQDDQKETNNRKRQRNQTHLRVDEKQKIKNRSNPKPTDLGDPNNRPNSKPTDFGDHNNRPNPKTTDFGDHNNRPNPKTTDFGDHNNRPNPKTTDFGDHNNRPNLKTTDFGQQKDRQNPKPKNLGEQFPVPNRYPYPEHPTLTDPRTKMD